MKLFAINTLCVEDVRFMRAITDDISVLTEEDEEKKEGESEGEDANTGGEGQGEGSEKNKKNEGSPAAKAYGSSGMSQQEISNKTGISKAEISKYKSPDDEIHRDPSVKSLEKLARAGVNVRQMLPSVFK